MASTLKLRLLLITLSDDKVQKTTSLQMHRQGQALQFCRSSRFADTVGFPIKNTPLRKMAYTQPGRPQVRHYLRCAEHYKYSWEKKFIENIQAQ